MKVGELGCHTDRPRAAALGQRPGVGDGGGERRIVSMEPAQAASYVQQTPGLGLAGHRNRDAPADAKPLAAAHGLSDTVATTWWLYFD
jgi:hypothetical protein